MRAVISIYGKRMLVKSPYNGCAILRNAIAEYLLRYRNISASPSNIVIGSGAEHLYGSIVKLLGRDVIYGLENPSYEMIRAVYESNGARCELLEMDNTGISEKSLNETQAGVLHVTPYNSFPTGITAPASKRFRYIDWARARDGIIVEDDFDSESSVSGRPVETIFSMDGGGSVIYVNTFSKSLAPSMRMGYMILPDELSEKYRRELGYYSCTVPTFDQYVLAHFIQEGHFERFLNRKRRLLRQQRKNLPE